MKAIATVKQHQQQRDGLTKLLQAVIDTPAPANSAATTAKHKSVKKGYRVYGVIGWTGPRPKGLIHGRIH